jgi:hypothetical protein
MKAKNNPYLPEVFMGVSLKPRFTEECGVLLFSEPT